jgi:hypothetical protein
MVLYVVQKVAGTSGRSSIVSRHVDVAYPDMPCAEPQIIVEKESTLSVSMNRDRKSLVIIRSTSRVRAASAADDRRFLQSAMDEVTHQKKSMFLVALEDLASGIMNLMPPSIRLLACGSEMLTASVIYNMRLAVPKRTLSTLSTARSFYERHVPSEDAPVTPMFNALTDRLEAVVSAGGYNARHGGGRPRMSMDRHWGLCEEISALTDAEVTQRHAMHFNEGRERIRLSQYEAGAHAVLRFQQQETVRSEALKRASMALDGQVELLRADAIRRCYAERQESIGRREAINALFDHAELTVLKPVDMDWVDVEVEKNVAEYTRSNSFFPNVV